MSRIRMSHVLVATLGLAMLAAAPAHAQFGGLLKKAKQAAEGKAEQQSNTATDPRGESLNEASLQTVFRGLDAERPKADRARSLWRRSDSLEKASKALMDSHEIEYNAYQSKQQAIEECRSSTFSNLEHEHEADMKKKQS